MQGYIFELFTSPTCPYCPEARRRVENLVKKLKNAVLIERDVSVPENAELAKKYGIMSVPALIINGKYKIVGLVSEEDILSYLYYV